MWRIVKYIVILVVTVLIVDYVMTYSKPTKYFELKSFEGPALAALQSYPELRETRIQFISVEKNKTAHQAIPKLSTLFLPKSLRVYQIKMTYHLEGAVDSTSYRNLTYDSQIGVLGHELAHILDFVDESSIQLIRKGLDYLNDEQYRVEYERATNCIAINRGLKDKIMIWTQEAHQSISDHGRGHYYHSPSELAVEGICK